MLPNLYQKGELTDRDFDFGGPGPRFKGARGRHGYIQFYAPWCPHCQSKVETWKRLAKEADPDTHFVHFVNTTNPACRRIVADRGITGIPRVFHYRGQGVWTDYPGDASDLGGLQSYLARQTPSQQGGGRRRPLGCDGGCQSGGGRALAGTQRGASTFWNRFPKGHLPLIHGFLRSVLEHPEVAHTNTMTVEVNAQTSTITAIYAARIGEIRIIGETPDRRYGIFKVGDDPTVYAGVEVRGRRYEREFQTLSALLSESS